MRLILLILAFGTGFAFYTGTASGGEAAARLRGDALSPDCNWLAVGISRFRLDYPLLGGLSGWSRGVPTVRSMVGEIYVFNRQTRVLRKAVDFKAPVRMAQDTDFSIRPRWLSGNQLVFSVHGCPKENQNCQDRLNFRVSATGAVSEMEDWPDVTAPESRDLDRCTSALDYRDDKTVVQVGPRNGPWTPVLTFDGKTLAPLPR